MVLDPGRLDDKRRKAYDTIMRAPIKAAVASARGQLKQSRIEINPDACNVLMVINNGFTAVSQEDLLSYVVGRAKNDTDEIDAVVVAGHYFHSDGMDSWALWPMDCVAIRSDRPLLEFDMLKASWGKLANRHMTDFVQGKHGENAQKEAQTDVVFDVGDTTYVKPAVQIGAASQFYGNGRPRRNRVTFDQIKHVVYTVPRLSPLEYRRVSPALRDEPLMVSYEVWDAHVAAALRAGTPDRPVVPADISHARWEAWLRKNPGRSGIASLRAAANSLYGARASELVHAARQPDESERLPKRYIWVLVELIGQDERNDVAHIGVIIDGEEQSLARNVRMGALQRSRLSRRTRHKVRDR